MNLRPHRFTIVLVALAAGCSRQPAPPVLHFATIGFILDLPEPMQKALDAAAPGFRSLRPNTFRADVAQAATLSASSMQALFAAISDFDGDGNLDVIVEGSLPRDAALHLFAIMNGAKPRAFEVTNFPTYDVDAPGIYLTRPAGEPKESFDVINYPDSSSRFTYKNGGFTGTAIGG